MSGTRLRSSRSVSGLSHLRKQTMRVRLMPLHTFVLRLGAAPLSDEAGVQLPCHGRALGYATDIVRELMQGREEQTRFWRLDVYEDNDLRLFKLSFAALGQTLDHLPAESRSLIETVCNW